MHSSECCHYFSLLCNCEDNFNKTWTEASTQTTSTKCSTKYAGRGLVQLRSKTWKGYSDFDTQISCIKDLLIFCIYVFQCDVPVPVSDHVSWWNADPAVNGPTKLSDISGAGVGAMYCVCTSGVISAQVLVLCLLSLCVRQWCQIRFRPIRYGSKVISSHLSYKLFLV